MHGKAGYCEMWNQCDNSVDLAWRSRNRPSVTCGSRPVRVIVAQRSGSRSVRVIRAQGRITTGRRIRRARITQNGKKDRKGALSPKVDLKGKKDKKDKRCKKVL